MNQHVIRDSFKRQAFMDLIGAELVRVEPGEVEIRLPFRAELTQQHGFLHAGVTTTILDNSCGYAALSLAPPGSSVLSIEFKVNLLAPARGEEFRAVGKVIKAGRTITVCTGEAYAIDGDRQKLIATMSATMMLLQRSDLPPG